MLCQRASQTLRAWGRHGSGTSWTRPTPIVSGAANRLLGGERVGGGLDLVSRGGRSSGCAGVCAMVSSGVRAVTGSHLVSRKRMWGAVGGAKRWLCAIKMVAVLDRGAGSEILWIGGGRVSPSARSGFGGVWGPDISSFPPVKALSGGL